MNETNKTNLLSVVNDMCLYTTKITTEKEGEGKNQKEVKYLDVNVTLKSYSEMTTSYAFSTEQIEMLQVMMNECQMNVTVGGAGITNLKNALTDIEINEITSKIIDEKQKQVVSFALSKVGYPYSQEKRDSGVAYDCSSLAYYAWKSFLMTEKLVQLQKQMD